MQDHHVQSSHHPHSWHQNPPIALIVVHHLEINECNYSKVCDLPIYPKTGPMAEAILIKPNNIAPLPAGAESSTNENPTV